MVCSSAENKEGAALVQCHFIVDTGPTASETMQKRYSIREEPITIG